MKRGKYIAAAALAGLLALGSGATYAFGERCDGWQHGHGGGGFGAMGAIYQLEDLTPDQLKQLHALQIKQRNEMEQARSERESLHDAIAKTTDPKALRPLAEKEGKLVTDRIMKRAEFRAEVEKILTPAQKTKLKAMKEEWDKRRGDRRDGHDGRGPGPQW